MCVSVLSIVAGTSLPRAHGYAQRVLLFSKHENLDERLGCTLMKGNKAAVSDCLMCY